MAKQIPRLDLVRNHPQRPNTSALLEQSSNSSIVCVTTPSLDSPLDPVQVIAPAIPLPAPKPDEDFVLLYRLSSEGRLLKVVRRRGFGPVDVGQMSRYHHKHLPMPQQRLRLSEPAIGLQPESKRSPTHRRNSCHSDIRTAPQVPRPNSTLSSASLMAAKRLLSTTLSLEYGPDHKKIRVNSSAKDFEAYYMHRHQRHVKADPLPLPPPIKLKDNCSSLPPGKALKIKHITKKLTKLLVEIEAGRGAVQTKSYKQSQLHRKRRIKGLGTTQTYTQASSLHKLQPQISISSSFAHSRSFSSGLYIKFLPEE